jgi:Domain of unknown function (DUF4062)
MIVKKKLQVFVSSTYSDLREERQAAVEAILTAGHIPAGMELFTAGDQSQMEVIKRWIDESDVFLLILGGRYGSIDPTSSKSYIQLEYEYAQEQAKPFFAVVIAEDYLRERIKVHGSDVIEADYPSQLRTFRTTILKRLVKFYRDPRDIKLAILETLSDFSRRDALVGWVQGNQAANTGALAEEIARLGKENASLREQLSKFGTEPNAHNALSGEYIDFLKLVLDNSDLQLLRKHGPKLKLTEEQTERKLALFGILVSIFERAYTLVYEEQMNELTRRLWSSWENYMCEWCGRADFRQALPDVLEGKDPDLKAHMDRLAQSAVTAAQ